MPALANQRHERFCWAVLRGKSDMRAYVDAGYSKKAANQNACRMRGNAGICARIKELQERRANAAVISGQQILERLTDIVADGGRDQLTIRALELLAKHHNLFAE